MNEWIDISVTVAPGKTPQWPGSTPVRYESKKSTCCGDSVNDRDLIMNLHTGTHIESAEHHFEGGATIESLSLEQTVGPCFVADFGGSKSIGVAELEAAKIPAGTKRLLMKTTNSSKWSPEFYPSFVALTVDACKWLAERKFVLVGNDYLSVQPYKGDNNVHRILLENGVAILEGVNLSGVAGGAYELVCLPLKLEAVEAAPVRAILRKLK